MYSFYYKLEYGSYYLYAEDDDRQELVLMTDQVAMGYDPETFTMIKHGSPEKVTEWVEKYRAAGLELHMVTFKKEFPVEEINKVLSTCGYLKFIINPPLAQ